MPIRQWKRHMHLEETGTIFEQYSDAKKKEHKLRVYRQYDKAKFKKNVKKATKKIITEPRNASVNVRMESLS